LGAYPLIDSTEGRYADVAREMVVSCRWVMPPLDPGIDFWAKPPLAFWATGLSLMAFGLNEFAARFPCYLFTLGTALLVGWIGHRIGGKWLAVVSALIYSSSGLPFVTAAGVMMDPPLAFFITLALAGFLQHLHECKTRPFGARPGWGLLVFFAMGGAVLSKGLIGIVLPAGTLILWALLRWQVAPILSLPWVGGISILALTTIPWHLMAEASSPGFLNYYIIGEHFSRFVDRGWEGDRFGNPHEAIRGTIWAYFVVALLPWALVLPWVYRSRLKGFAQQVRKSDRLALLLAAALAPLCFFTLSGNVMRTYPLPSLPWAAVLLGLLVVPLLRRRPNRKRLSLPRAANRPDTPWLRPFRLPKPVLFAAFLMPLGASAISAFLLPSLYQDRSQKQVAEYFLGLPNSDSAELLYFERAPQSADFYTNGAAVFLEEEARASVRQAIRDRRPSVIVVEDGEVDEFQLIEGTQNLRHVGTFGEWMVFKDF
jgi:4-amino-4-deoxy-L-arabinose transferase-like glycosyltransferase